MDDLRRPPLRLLVGLAVGVLALIEIQSLAQTVRSQTRLRGRLMRGVESSLRAARPQIEARLQEGGERAWNEALEAALRTTGAAEAELFDFSGKRLAARPEAAPVEHWPQREIDALKPGTVLAMGPVAGRESRVLVYAASVSGGQPVILRLATSAPELVEDLRERRGLLLGHALALLVLLLAGGMALVPARSVPPSAPGAMDAYVEAMERLRYHGEALSMMHETERQRMEEVIRDKDAMARAGELTAGMVHEVRNGLGTILGYARLLEQGAAGTPGEAGQRIREECETLETVVRRFMDFVRRETLNLAPLDLPRLLSRVAARESSSRPGAQVALNAVPQTVVGDEELLERAFENLVRNAREAAGEGGHVWLDWAEADGWITVTVSDDGPGLSAKAREQLRPFFTTKAAGLGLGMPIALKIVRLHGGELVLADRSPRGLAVRVRLPVGGPRGDQPGLPTVGGERTP